MVVARDPDSGVLNASYNRLQLRGGPRCGMYIQPRHLLQIYAKNAARQRPTQVVVVFGMDTAVRLSAATWGSNIPLEGRILPGVMEPEGPMAEFTGVYGSTEPKHVFESNAVAVDPDVAITDPRALQFALATRVQATGTSS
jgi:2,5-furandicarboxylate decarboxylase 1